MGERGVKIRKKTADVFNGWYLKSQHKFQIDITLSMLRVHLSDGKFDWIVCEMANSECKDHVILCFDEVLIVFNKHF